MPMSVLKTNLRSLKRKFGPAAHRLGSMDHGEGGPLRTDRKPFAPDGHYHSPVVNLDEVERDQERIWPAAPELQGIDFNRAAHEHFLAGPFARFIGDYDYPVKAPEDGQPPRFYERNPMFSKLDARVLFIMLRALRPRKMIEIGSGYSSLLTADVNRRYLGGALELICVEPSPPPFLRRRDDGIARVIAKRAQNLRGLHRELQPGDILFIDSSHVAKTGSDVNHLYFEVLPRLAPGVIVHIHDIFLPLDYPKHWVFGGRSWNEQYLVQAMLTFTNAFKILFSCAYCHHAMRPVLAQSLGGEPLDGQSLWLLKLDPAHPDRDPGRAARGW
jgi:predicted O-methyltransferase YrrM